MCLSTFQTALGFHTGVNSAQQELRLPKTIHAHFCHQLSAIRPTLNSEHVIATYMAYRPMRLKGMVDWMGLYGIFNTKQVILCL